MKEITQFGMAAILIFIFYKHWSRKISEDFPIFFSFIFMNILKMTKINSVTDYISWILYYIIFIICFRNALLCLKGRVSVLRVIFIGVEFLIGTYLIIN